MSMKEFLFDRAFYRGVLTLGLPIAAQNLLSSSASLIDTVMVGQLGEVPLSAVGMAGQWSFFMFLFYFGFSSGSSVFFSQYWGVKDMSRIRHTYSRLHTGRLLGTPTATYIASICLNILSYLGGRSSWISIYATYASIYGTLRHSLIAQK